MSHCCGGCGGEDPSKKKSETSEKEVDIAQDKSSADKSSAENTTSPTGTWQPAGK